MTQHPLIRHLGYCTNVMDPVHGAIALHAHETAILDHPLVQRLKCLKQNDVLHYVFPGATHTRFAHSLGVMHVAGRCLEAMIASTLADREKRGQEHRKLTEAQVGAVSYFTYIIRSAALLHDTGHGPFSHEFEDSTQLQKVIKEEGVLESLWEEDVALKYLGRRPKEFAHEEMSIRIALNVLDSVLRAETAKQDPIAAKLVADDVIAVMDPSVNPTSATFDAEAKQLLTVFLPPEAAVHGDASGSVKTILRSILSGTLNADAMDYMLRDSYFTGSKYGVFNLDHLVSNLRVGFALTQTRQLSWIGLAVHERGVGALDDFTFSRLQLYREVYGHKTVVGFKILLSQSISEVISDKTKRRIITEQLRDVDKYCLLHDESMVALFHDVADTDTDSACHDFIYRTKLVFLERLRNPNKGRIAQMQKELDVEDKDARVLSRETNVRGDPTAKGVDQIRVLRTPRTHPPELIDLADVRSSFSQTFNYRTIDFYRAARGWARSKRESGPGTKGILISGVGLPCCGKSTVMRYLAALLDGVYFREPEEAKWPDAVMKRDRVGVITALTWFRAIRVPYLYNGDEVRRRGGVAVVDSCYDKLIAKYLGKEHVKWLIDPSDPYYEAYAAIAALDLERLPNPDVFVVFKISKEDWITLLKKRGRSLDKDEAFLRSYESQDYFEAAAKEVASEKGLKVSVFTQRLALRETAEDAARRLAAELRPVLTQIRTPHD